MRRLAVVAALALATTACSSGDPAPAPRAEQTPSTAHSYEATDVTPPGSGPLPARWWQWAGSFERGQDPISDATGARCGDRQPGDVWFLAGTFGGAAARSCRVPSGRPIYVPVLNQVCEVTGGARQAKADCRVPVDTTEATLDGRALPVRQAVTGPFDLEVPDGSVIGFPAGTARAVSWGSWVGPVDVPDGQHVLELTGRAGDFSVQVRYRLEVG
jgi:hypothetical protein